MRANLTPRIFACFSFLAITSGSIMYPAAAALANTSTIKKEKSIIEQILVQGTITDSKDGSSLPGVSVTVKGLTQSTVTDKDGKFSIRAEENAVLVFSYIGYTRQEIAINSRTSINVKLEASNNVLDDVVVVGYGTVKRRDLTGSVATVKADDIKRSPAVNVTNLLQGQVSGVTVTNPSGAPGANATIRIRGQNSPTGGSDPLYVIDGVIINNDNQKKQGLFTGDGFANRTGISTLASLNPADIETMEVLKDASATAIYGTRGSNGVILITTKRGKAGAAVVDFNVETGTQRAANRYNLLNAEQFAALNAEARANSIITPALAPAALSTDYNSDWQNEVLRNAPLTNYQFSVRGGTAKTTYNFSANHFDQKGIAKGNDLKRYSVRLNLDNQATKWLKVGTSTSLTRETSHLFYSFSNVLSLVPNQPFYSPNTTLYGFNSDLIDPSLNLNLSAAGVSALTVAGSPLYDINVATNQLVQNRILTSNYAEISFLKNFKFRTSLGIDAIDLRDQAFRPQRSSVDNRSNAFAGYGNSFDYLIDNILSYSKDFNNHSVNAFVGQSAQKHNDDYVATRAQGVNDNTTYNSYEGSTLSSRVAVPTAEVFSLASFLGRVNYAYKHRYLATVSLRRDGSSRFGTNHKWANFPAASLAWVITEENFMKKFNAISQLKLRAGYGVTGNQDIESYKSLSLITTNKSTFNNSQTIIVGREPANSPNPDLTWEETRQSNIGLDLGFLKNRVTLTADVYRKFTDKLLYSLPLPLTSGFASILANAGSVINKGWELSLSSNNIRAKDFNWRSNFNISRNYNEINELPGGEKIITDGGNNKNVTILRQGEALNSWYGYVTDGIFQPGDDFSHQPDATVGERRFKKIDPASTTIISASEDRVVLGNSNPRLTYGFTNDFSWKKIDLSFFFQGVQGRDVFNYTRQQLSSVSGSGNVSTDVLDRWSPSNPNAKFTIARQTGSKNTYGGFNSFYIDDASYLKLRNITLGYSLPKALINKFGSNNLRIYGSVANVFTITKYKGLDPDVSSVDEYPYPVARTFSFGISTQF